MQGSRSRPFPSVDVIGTPCALTSHAELTRFLDEEIAGRSRLVRVDFTNVHIVTLRRLDRHFREITEATDFFVPDSQVLVFAVRTRGGARSERVYGPDFMRYCLTNSAPDTRHYLLGGSEATLAALLTAMTQRRPGLRIVGSHHGYFREEEEPAIVEDIRRSGADLIWVGLGTPKQQEWIARNAALLGRGALLAVGFAFDVNAGTKADAPAWMGRLGLTWLFRLASEPRRLFWRYAYYNSMFLFYLARQLAGIDHAPPPAAPGPE